MNTYYVRRPLLMVLLAGLTFLSCGNTDERNGSAQQETPVPNGRHSIELVFDPTVFETGDDGVENADELLSTIRKFITGLPLPPETVLGTWLAQADGDRQSAHRRDRLEVDYSPQRHVIHERRKTEVGVNVIDDLESAWHTAHHGDEPNVASSCLISTMYYAARSARDAPRIENERKSMVIVSDMVEACSDWGINMERTLREIPDLPANLDLSVFDNVSVLLVQSRHTADIVSLERLEGIWKDFFHRYGIPEEKLRMSLTDISL